MTQSHEYYDNLETRAPEVRERELMAALRGQIGHAKANAPAYARILADCDPRRITSREALAQLALTRKAALMEMQKTHPPFGGLAAGDGENLSLVLMSPGPIYEPQSDRPDYWRMGRALYAAGFRRGEIIHNSFSYHLSPGAWIAHSGIIALGCAVLPGGVGNTESQARAIAHVRPNGYVGTPDFLKVLLDKAAELSLDLGSLSKALVSGAALPPSLRAELKGRGIAVSQCYAIGDIGLVAYESHAQEGMIVDEGVLLEIVRPGAGNPVAEGEVGEVVVTTLNPDYPLIRLATGDLSAVLPGISPCGRTNQRLKGWLGRVDQTTKVKGLFVTPGQVAQTLARHPEAGKGRLVVERVEQGDAMTLHCEAAGDDETLVKGLRASLQAVCKLKGEVKLVSPGSLPNDGKVIDDRREYE